MFAKNFLLASVLLTSTAALPASAADCVCSLEQLSQGFTSVAEKAIPAVVFIRTESSQGDYEGYGQPGGRGQNPYGSPFEDDFFNRFFSPYGRPQQPQPQQAQGSGFLISADGLIMTNAHVVKGADKIEVTLHDGLVLTAALIGADPQTDVAIIKVEGKDFPFLPLGNSDDLKIAEMVLAIGSPFQLSSTVTHGIVSAKLRQNLQIAEYEEFIQVDAPINPGNSGGPLINLRGECVGINTAIFSRSGGYMGIGFAIPSNMAKGIMDQLISKGAVTRGFMGISPQPVDKDIAAGFNLEKAEGVLVAEVEPGSPADKAGLKQGDIIMEYNGKAAKSFQTFRNDIAMMNPGSTVTLKVNRKGQILTVPVTLGARAENKTAPSILGQKIGIELDNLTPELAKQLGYTRGEEGVVIMKVKPGSPASMAGLRPGYLILAVNHKKVTNMNEYNDTVTEASKNKRILLLVRQGNMTRFYSIKMD